MEADSPRGAEELLWRSDLVVARVSPVRRLPPLHKLLPTLFGTASAAQVAAWARQLATLLDAGITLLAALEVLQGEQSTPAIREAGRNVAASLREGKSLGEALGQNPTIFPSILVRLIRIGEQTGGLPSMLRRSADYLEAQAAVRGKLRSSLTYPAIVASTSAVSVYILLTFTIPMLAGLLEEFKADLPFITRMVVLLGNLAQVWTARVILLVLVSAILLFLYKRRPGGKERLDRVMYRMPLFGKLIHTNLLSRTTQTMASLLAAGVPLLEAVQLTRENTDNVIMLEALNLIREDLLEGKSLSQGLAHARVFPSILSEMCAVGEQSGNLTEQLNIASGILQADFEKVMNRFVGLMEPAMILMVGGIVGLVGVTVITTVYSVLPQVGK